MRRTAPALLVVSAVLLSRSAEAQSDASALLDQLDVEQGVCIVWNPADSRLPLELARQSRLIVYVQTDNPSLLSALHESAEAEGLLGERLYAEFETQPRLHLADNFADGAILGPETVLNDDAIRREVLRVLHPSAKAVAGDTSIVKPRPAGADDWGHPYHGPDNNPQSRDQNARAPYLTQFLCEPWYVPMPQVTVASGGRVFKAFGHIALKEREWPWLNSLVAIDGFNATFLWKRPLKPGFMLHRNTLVATPELVYLADDVSCKRLDAATGKVHDEIVIPKPVDEDGVWKWLALQDGVLYALIGANEPLDEVIRGTRRRPGWPWRGLGEGYAGQYAWGFGRTLLAMNPQSQEVLWTYRSDTPIDSRAMCLSAGQLYVYSHQKFLAAVDAKSGSELWKSTDERTLKAIGEHDRAQNPRLGFASSTYAKANGHGIYFAGPQRTQLVAVSAKTGSLMWDYPHGNFQLVLRDDGLYALGRMETSKKFDFQNGTVLADLECYRGNCTRATGTVDSIFTRGYRHTGTMRLDVSKNEAKRIPLMRPACQDGVIVSEGMCYWGPWMCDCNHSLVGMICLAPAGDFDFSQAADEAERLEVATEDGPPTAAQADRRDWTSYRAGPARTASTPVAVSESVELSWQYRPASGAKPTAPVTAGSLVFWAGLDGVVRAADSNDGSLKWTAATGGAIRFPPEVWNGRVYVGSGDGHVYCFEAESGRRLWRFRAAPSQRKIMVHGRLLSNWPVGSGVLVHDGTVYAAAGITSYDGTHVYALDAKTGTIRWQNNSSGHLVAEDRVTGVSVQGHLLLHDGRLYLAGGNVVSPAMYDLADGRCLNKLSDEWWERPAGTARRFPSQPKSEMFHRSPRGRELFLVDGTVRVFDQLLYSPPNNGSSRYFGGHFLQVSSNETMVRGTTGRIVRIKTAKSEDGKPVGLWEHRGFYDPLAMALAPNAVIVAGQLDDEAAADDQPPSVERYAVTALKIDDGNELWSQELPAAPVSWGVAVDRTGRVALSLADGRIVTLAAK